MHRRDRNAFATSAATHALLVAGVFAYARSHPAVFVFDPPAQTIDIDFALAPLQTPRSAPIEVPNTIEARRTQLVEPPPTRAANSNTPSARSAHAGIDTQVEPLPGPEPTPGNAAPVPPADPFLAWSPHGAPTHPAGAAPLRGIELLARADEDAPRAGIANGLENTNGPQGHTDHPGDAPAVPNAAQVQEASAGYVRRLLDDAAPTQIAGSVPYFTRIAHEATRIFHPVAVPAPTLAQAVLNTFFTTPEVAMDATRRSLGPLAGARSGSAIDSLNWAHPNSDLPQLTNTMSARAAATARTTTVEIEVDQDATGHVIATRVLRRSGVTGYDRTAMEAIREAVRGFDPPPMTGIWRSHWAFDVTTSRDPIISALPGLPGAPITPGITAELEFDEVTGQTEMHLPGMLHTRRRVRLVSSRVVTPSSGAPPAAPQTPHR